MSADLPVAYILGTVPQPSQTFIAREVRGLLRRGVPLVVFALRRRSADLLEQDDRPWFNAVQFVPRTLAPAVLAANVQLLARQPARYLRTLARLVALQHRPSVLAVRAVSLFLRSVWIARQIARAGGCRLVHGHFALAQTEVAMATAGLLGCKFSFTAHARDIYASPSALEDKIRAAALVVSCTASNVAYLRSLCPDVMDRIHLAHHGVEVVEERAFAGAWTSQSEPARVPTILAAGRLVPKKGFDTLLEACARLRQRGVVFRCRLFGDGPEAARLRRLIDQSGIDACVTLAGWAPPSALLREMTSATVFAMPSRVSPRGDRDGLPNVILEAMASAVPVVATAVSGIPEAVVDGVTGLLVEPDNPEALADALERLLESRELRAAMGRAATERIRREFSLDAAADRMAALFEQVAPRPALQRQKTSGFPR